MDITPNLVATRFAELNSGDLFVCPDEAGPYVAILTTDPTANGNKLALRLGPTFEPNTQFPALKSCPPSLTVLSFGKDYSLRLPCNTSGWLNTEPSEGPCLLLEQDKLFLRGLVGFYGVRPTLCYVGVQDGVIYTVRSASGRNELSHPGLECACAVEWAFLTTESLPRVILSFPLDNSSKVDAG